MALENDIQQRLIAELCLMAGMYLEHGWRDKAAETLDLVRKIENAKNGASNIDSITRDNPSDRIKGS